VSSRPPVRVLLVGIVLLLAIAVSTHFLRAPAAELTPASRLALALTPTVLAAWLIIEYVKVMRRADEFARRVMLEALAIAYPVALLIGMTVEYLQKAGFLLDVNVGRLWPVLGLVWLVTYGYAWRRYR
jgi:hypothetical protein